MERVDDWAEAGDWSREGSAVSDTDDAETGRPGGTGQAVQAPLTPLPQGSLKEEV